MSDGENVTQFGSLVCFGQQEWSENICGGNTAALWVVCSSYQQNIHNFLLFFVISDSKGRVIL